MRVAIPCEGNQVCELFGHAPEFMFIDADLGKGQIEKEERLAAPSHQPGLLPQWVAAQGADIVLATGMGGQAVELFAQQGVDVVTGVTLRDPRRAVEDYLGGMLSVGANAYGQQGSGGERSH